MRFIRIKEVTRLTGLGRTSVYNYMKDGKFPKSIPLGDRAVAWKEAEVMDWMLAKLAERDAK